MQFGDLELTPLCDGIFRLDGGAMFGVVPKPLWEKRAPADERNRIRLGHAAAPRPGRDGPGRTMLIDAGIGDKMDAKSVEIYAVDRSRNLDHSLAEAGVSRDDIDIVLATHLHFDHAGGFTARDAVRGARARASRARATSCAGGVGRCDASARAEPRQLPAGEFRAAGRGRRAGAGGRR